MDVLFRNGLYTVFKKWFLCVFLRLYTVLLNHRATDVEIRWDFAVFPVVFRHVPCVFPFQVVAEKLTNTQRRLGNLGAALDAKVRLGFSGYNDIWMNYIDLTESIDKYIYIFRRYHISLEYWKYSMVNIIGYFRIYHDIYIYIYILVNELYNMDDIYIYN